MRYARWIVRLRFVVIAGWLVGSWWALQQPHVDLQRGGAGVRDLAPVDLPAVQAELRGAEAFPVPLHSRTLLVQRAERGLTLPQQRRVLERAAIDPREPVDPRWPDLLGGVPILNTAGLAPGSREADTGAVTFLVFHPDTGERRRVQQAQQLRADAREDGTRAYVTGAIPARLEAADRLLDVLPRLELVTAAAIALVVAFFYRSFLAPVVVLAAIGVAYTASQLVLTRLATAADQQIPREVEPVLVALILGIVTTTASSSCPGCAASWTPERRHVRQRCAPSPPT